MPVRALLELLRMTFDITGASWNWTQSDGSSGAIVEPSNVLLDEPEFLELWLTGEARAFHPLLAWFVGHGGVTNGVTGRPFDQAWSPTRSLGRTLASGRASGRSRRTASSLCALRPHPAFGLPSKRALGVKLRNSTYRRNPRNRRAAPGGLTSSCRHPPVVYAQLWHQDMPGMPGMGERGDHFRSIDRPDWCWKERWAGAGSKRRRGRGSWRPGWANHPFLLGSDDSAD